MDMQIKTKIDPITLEVVTEGLIAIVREMRANVVRTSYSAAVYELDDFSCALFSIDAELVAQYNDLPSHIIPMPWGVRCVMEDLGGDLAPGDVILFNDSYRGGTHLNDVTVLVPMFVDGELFMFPGVRTHWADVGGMSPGSYSGTAQSIFQEGVRIPPLKLYDRGKLNKGVLDLVLCNMRIPSERLGDLNSQIGACRIAEGRLRKMIEKYGKDTVKACINLNLDRAERRMRDQISALPDGDYVYEDYLEYYDEGVLDPVLMKLKLSIRGDEIVADFAGSNPQVPGPVNSSLAVAGAGVFVALKATLDPGGAVNGGSFRPISFTAPEASIVDVKPDAPAGAHAEVRKRSLSVMLGALSQVALKHVSGDLCGTSFPNNMGGYHSADRRNYVYLEVPAGGNGGFAEHDGSSAFVNVDHGNVRSIETVENLEATIPFLVERCELRRDSGGEGASRGGLGMHRELRLLDTEAEYSVLSDRAVIPPFGMSRAHASHQVRASIMRGSDERPLATPGKTTGLKLREGDIVIMESAGGGGYGDPLTRDPEKVRADVEGGYVSRERASERYGVVFSGDGRVDQSATTARRAEIAAARLKWTVRGDESDPYEGRRGRHRMLSLSQKQARTLGADQGTLVELHGRNPAPLRAWVKLVDDGDESIPLDEFGRKVLGIRPGDEVELRVLAMPHVPAGLSNPANKDRSNALHA
ncbi:hydantoinase B/oxoprolinase family protein [Pseudaminobacter sp. 19-2017]|uniref:Hydantoinase B/oxoprolinase family protein n=1 Tax=Pseudaminobacter soli (ex Zhang et al. 2022) TaxID=2831468 RepID=A0A942I3E4_9HYPH|nr:hydantoinase B/oxoprolinase family protein [Pseudaminobacter soli]MBS3649819.1 hydantoinase B/oxoprolinase family protein [Pseudaminobacter soli]